MGDMAGVAAHVQCGVATSLFRHIDARLVAIEAEVFLFASRSRLQELILVVAGMRTVAAQAIAHRGGVHRSFNVGCFFIRVAGDAQAIGGCGDQFDACDVFVDPHLVATQAACSHGGVDRFPLRLVVVTLQTLGRVNILVQRYWMHCGNGAGRKQCNYGDENPEGQALSTGARV